MLHEKKGFIALQRKVLEWEWYNDIPTKTLFIHILLKANFKDKNWQDFNITGIKFLLDRALDNLISNAVRHSPKNGKIEIRCEIDKKHCCLSVWDEGEGVSEESLEEIFEPFFRIDSSRNRQTGGFGLGLSLVKSIAELHKGSVIASNHPNGFEVKLILPLGK